MWIYGILGLPYATTPFQQVPSSQEQKGQPGQKKMGHESVKIKQAALAAAQKAEKVAEAPFCGGHNERRMGRT